MGNVTNARARFLRAKFGAKNIDALVITSKANVTYLTGFGGDDSWALVTPKRTYLLTDSRYTEEAQKECDGAVIIERKEGLAATVAAILKKQAGVNTVGIEDCATVAVFAAVRKAVDAKLKKASGLVEELRLIKDETEVLAIKRAAAIGGEAFEATMRYVRPGVSESELAGRLNFEIRRRGARESFETIVAFGANASMAHHLCSERKLKANDTVLIDWGVRYKGYCSDMTRSFSVGRASAYFARVYKAVLEAQQTAIAMVRAGTKIAAIDKAARDVIKGHGLPVYGHGTGHGVGLEVHEGPVVSGRTKGVLKAGEVITIEPGVYAAGRLGVRIEDDILVTEKGCRVLSPELGK